MARARKARVSVGHERKPRRGKAAAASPRSGSNRRSARQDNRRSHLVDAAARLLRERGFHATSTRDIADAVGMLSGSIYYHFPSKEALLLAVYEEGLRRALARLDGAIASRTDPWKRLCAACAAHLDALLARDDYLQVMIKTLPEEGGRLAGKLRDLRDRYEERFKSLIAALPLGRSTDRHYVRLYLLGALNWSHVWYRPGGDPPKTIAENFFRILRRGLNP
jgi:TetR/AcrR family transcriptional regulator, cholesterol catabolism regulator